ncbi:class I SAM-dependent methyltransferase [Pseudomonas sp. CAN2814]|uniref:class I SAM-dependent methyltransferase n=1 Tax=Pseudomonas sp. CAN1 TaxID=3046726 RepID=UPI002648CC79|nr:class I SAM-dependent methyltransferase [Pseudomonas sp. CAN1]MDN6856387.1 class I SAM-dependent methyltransferase [Pseudomonas sp. CAN1]
MAGRLNSPIWRHDAFVLRRLQTTVQAVVTTLNACGKLNKSARVVDFGCGDAPYKSLFDSSCREYLRCDLEGNDLADLHFKEGEQLPLEHHSADCVVSFQVLEHVWEVQQYLAECKRVLQPDGRLLLSTHGVWLYHPHPGDYRRWTGDGLCRELELAGFEVLEVRPIVGPLAWTTQFRSLAYHHLFSRMGWLGKVMSAAVCTLMYGRMWVEDKVTPASIRDSNASVYLLVAKPREK